MPFFNFSGRPIAIVPLQIQLATMKNEFPILPIAIADRPSEFATLPNEIAALPNEIAIRQNALAIPPMALE
ncbi:hypothetical protein [Hydrogenispora ethanolica]|jgi:hypothetical protein|uniref:hypothetical protein n=1 Tax=Hydrogenispora ethanolica TaxID=1082276 RepID=UPI0010515D09|nr:hypothetical protein [Hydrogenispora ethanolica]